ncbi:BREX-2 system adenine-specific DNA-methyltransferase PglX [Streptomyces werraensis]|uniref:BREX-2 system adenine-specific DNA-methyltransferase PglX n=1 Tax=Streptomyces werraensis TaxID=68284 RepID=UPI0037D06F88
MREVTVTDAVEGAGSESGSGLDKDALLKDLKRQVVALEDDLRERSESVEEFRVRLRAEYDQAVEASRRAQGTYGAWRDERVTQAAVAWVLACVFVRFCEDNGLIEEPFIAGPGERLVEAEERHEAFFREHPHLNNRDWLIAAFRHVAAANETAAGLFDEAHNPLWGLTPSYEAATELLGFWRRWGADGRIRYDFTDPEWDTRFLGDLYQHLSEHARKTYALYQTPKFVEEFILDLTLEPAVSEENFGLDPVWVGPDGEERRGLRTIDPACGSGHFLLGIFRRLVERWRAATPTADDWTVVRQALESVHGCDKNPFAVSIARFRLLVAAMKEAGAVTLTEAPSFPIYVAVGDSLLHGRGVTGEQLGVEVRVNVDGTSEFVESRIYSYSTEDVDEYVGRVDLLGRGSYHVVVGNPPYVEVQEEQEKNNYKAHYKTCKGRWTLTVPFAQRIFELAIRAGGVSRAGGFTGQITGNSFAKAKFGRSLVENFFPTVDVRKVIDASGVRIPGHGTATVIIVGRNAFPRQAEPVRVVQHIRAEPKRLSDPSKGVVWKAITALHDDPRGVSEWVSVEDVPREQMNHHPWSLAGGGVGQVMSALEDACEGVLGDWLVRAGFYGVLGEDDAFLASRNVFERLGCETAATLPLVAGEDVRDWNIRANSWAFHPYDEERELQSLAEFPKHAKRIWGLRTLLGNRLTFSRDTYFQDGRSWHEWHQIPKDRETHKWAISFAAVATHNHFVIDRSGAAFNRSAPILRLHPAMGEDEHMKSLGLLNSSAACFWLKQVNPPKSGSGEGRGVQDEAWEERYTFNATPLKKFPLPRRFPLRAARALESMAEDLMGCEPKSLCRNSIPDRNALSVARHEYEFTRRRMVAVQEELDWEVYGLFGLLDEREIVELTVPQEHFDALPEVCPGERAFEIVMARQSAKTAWFERHESKRVTEIPDRWPDWYQDIVRARVNLIERGGKGVEIIERPEYKRRWVVEPWVKKEKEALRSWLLDRCEHRSLWFGLRDGVQQPRVLTVNQLSDVLGSNANVRAVAALYATDHMGKPDLPLSQVLADVIAEEHVPYLAAMCYKDSGLRKREQWEEVWELQREEDRAGQRLDIPVPPKYTSADFLRASFWSNRGKLDVLKERFISYPEASPDGDSTLLLGWAGWDHKEQAQALVNLIEDRTAQSGWGTERILPLIAGLREVMPWVKQWHGEYDAEWEGVPAEDCETYLEEQMTKHQLSAVDLKAWRPVKKTRGRKAAAPKKPSAASEQTGLDSD